MMNIKLGILGGGQLGKMLVQAASKWHLPTYILDKSKDFPAGAICTHFVEGDFNDYDTVYNFGKDKDILTIEIEHVNTDALEALERQGVKVHPSAKALKTIKDKGLQKLFYAAAELPTAAFSIYDTVAEIKRDIAANKLRFPFVQKARTDGYDGRGVAVIHSEQDMDKLLPVPSIVEEAIAIEKEIAVIVARNEQGEIKAFPAVEMAFHPTANLVEFLACPANIDNKIAEKAINLAKLTIETFDMCGLLAVELFLTENGEILINEVAPRPHNSGHHTIESAYTSQYQQHLRAILNLPLGDTQLLSPAVTVNLLGAKGYTGKAIFKGIEDCLQLSGVHLHLYGKNTTKPFRKMGHATILNQDIEGAKIIAKKVKKSLKIESKA